MPDKFILLVEDNLDDASLTVRALKKADVKHEVVVVRDGMEALDFLFGAGIYEGRDVQEMPWFIVLDLGMPLMNGKTLLQRVRADERTRQIPVVILSISEERRGIEESYDLGANSYICKPSNSEAFIEAVKQVANYWLGLNVI